MYLPKQSRNLPLSATKQLEQIKTSKYLLVNGGAMKNRVYVGVYIFPGTAETIKNW